MIKFEVRGVEKVQAFLREVPRGTLRVALDAISEYLIGDERRGLKHNPPRVEHGPGNPYKWQSEKQRRAYFATDGFGGGIPYKRTGNLADGWEKKSYRDGYQTRITNKTKYAGYVQGAQQQKGHAADRWRKFNDIISSNTNGAMRAAMAAVKKWLRERA